MAFVSVTRLRPRALRVLPRIALHSWRSAQQAQRSDGFIGGYLASGPGFALWTVTLWIDEAAMRAFRNHDAHRRAMPLLIDACDEAAVVHWTAADPQSPLPAEIAERMRLSGRTSKLRHPSPDHDAGRTWPDGKVPRLARRLAPV